MKMILAQFLLLVLIRRVISVVDRESLACTFGMLPIYYSREELLSLRPARTTLPVDIPEVVSGQRVCSRRPRRRQKRGGIRQRLRNRGNKPPLPTMIVSNVRSLEVLHVCHLVVGNTNAILHHIRNYSLFHEV